MALENQRYLIPHTIDFLSIKEKKEERGAQQRKHQECSDSSWAGCA